MLNEEEKRYLSSTRLSVKINYVELEDNYDDGNIFYHYGKGIVISTINSETYIDKNYYTEDRLIRLLEEIFTCLDTNELILPEEFFKIDIINKVFSKLSCRKIIIDGKHKVNLNQLMAINKNTNIKELKVPEVKKNIAKKNFHFKIIPNIDNQFSSEKFKKFLIDDILQLRTLDIELPLKDDYTNENNEPISEGKDLDKIINVLVGIDTLSFAILDNGSKSIPQSLQIVEKIEKSIGSKIENIYFVTGNRDLENIMLLKDLEKDHKLSIMYDREIICSVDDFVNMRNNIKKLLEPIKKYQLSPLEKALFVYDTVKNFYIVNYKYMKKKKVSRVIHRIFIPNELNCQAYAALYAQLLRELKIQASDYSLYTPLISELFLTKDNHSRTMVRLVDDKYAINGLFNTDVIWDAMGKLKGKYQYEYFLKSIPNIKKQFAKDDFHNDIEILVSNKNIGELSPKERQVFEILLNKKKINERDIIHLKKVMTNNISLKIFLYALSTVRVVQGMDRNIIKAELVATTNYHNGKEGFKDIFTDPNEDLSYLDINPEKGKKS